jgi:uncharacterized damage-inducible protein DinB
MNKTDILTLYAYTCWATRRVLTASHRLTPEQFVTPILPTHGSLRAVMVHVLSAEITWRTRCQDRISPEKGLAEADFASLAELVDRWQAEKAMTSAYLAGLTDEALQADVAYRTTKGVPFEEPLWELLLQVITHGVQHRAEAGMILTAYGASPGDLDWILYLREKR